jgi:lipopolysaccharide transport system ATP-binding protein
MQPAIEIRNLGKQYTLAESKRYIALRDVITDSLRNITGSKKKAEKFWALKDINLDIMPGERVGIIGRNGAGKSTLLKIISRITPPTTGEAIIKGRVGSLLEVGTGFHPELTGRENIFLNGSILGLKKSEINRQLDAIIDFSGVEKFIDMPLKQYSSGMEMRLAFSVAAHLRSEILLIDEVLAVGDMEFQKKCLGKMEEVSMSEGRTILFVSHNMNYISSLCSKAVLLNEGVINLSGTPMSVISHYSTTLLKSNFESSSGNEIVRLKNLRLIDGSMNEKSSFAVNELAGIEMQYEVLQPGHILWAGFNLYNQDGVNVFDTHNINTVYYKEPHKTGFYTAIAWIPANLLNTGTYFAGCAVFNHMQSVIHFHEKEAVVFTVYDVFDSQTARGNSPGDFPGVIRPILNWEIKRMD